MQLSVQKSSGNPEVSEIQAYSLQLVVNGIPVHKNWCGQILQHTSRV